MGSIAAAPKGAAQSGENDRGREVSSLDGWHASEIHPFVEYLPQARHGLGQVLGPRYDSTVFPWGARRPTGQTWPPKLTPGATEHRIQVYFWGPAPRCPAGTGLPLSGEVGEWEQEKHVQDSQVAGVHSVTFRVSWMSSQIRLLPEWKPLQWPEIPLREWCCRCDSYFHSKIPDLPSLC